MVLTRSHRPGCTPPKPLTPVSKRKKRLKSKGSPSSSDDDCVVELNMSRKSLAEKLESISEENEEGLFDENENKVSKTIAKERQFNEESVILNMKPAPSQLDTITEETEIEKVDNDHHKMTSDYCQDSPERLSSNTDIVDQQSGGNVIKEKQHKFYFPPAKSFVPPHIKPSGIDVGMEIQETYIDVKCSKIEKKKIESLYREGTVNEKDSQLKDSVITPDFETKLAIPAEKSIQQQRKERKQLREESAGKDWFNMKPPEMTDDVKRDLNILQMRSVLDPKRFYKHNDRKALPRYFQVGKIMDNPADFYSSRVPKKQRKQNLTEELLADAEFQRFQKRKYNEIQMKKRALGSKKRRMKHGKFSKRKKESA